MLSTFGRRLLAIMGFAAIGLAVFEYSPERYVTRPDLEQTSASFVKRTRDGLQVLVTPSTLSVERRQGVRLRAAHDFDQRCGRVDATIPELNWQQSLTRKELFEGLEIQMNPGARSAPPRFPSFSRSRSCRRSRLSVPRDSCCGQGPRSTASVRSSFCPSWSEWRSSEVPPGCQWWSVGTPISDCWTATDRLDRAYS